MNRSFRDLERGKMGSLKIKDNKDEDLALFREMRKLEKERGDLLLFQNTEEFDDTLGLKPGSSPIFHINSGTNATVRKTGADDFLNSDNDKNDYEWLLTPPGTPLFPSLEMESQKTVMNQLETQNARPTARALKSRMANPQPEPAARNNLSRQPNLSSGLNTSSGGLRRPSSSGGPGSRPATPTSRSTASSTSRSTLITASNRPKSASSTRPTSITAPKVAPKATSTSAAKPSRSATPTSHPTLSSTKPTVRARSSTPTGRSASRPSTPPSKSSAPASKSTSRASTPTRRPTLSNGTSTPVVSSRSSASSSVSRPVATTVKNSASRPSSPSPSPSLRPKPWKPAEMPGFSLDTPPNLRTTLPDRPPSATRGRPGAPSSRSSSIEPVPNGRVRRQSCSPARGRPPNGIIRNSGSSVPVLAVNRLQAKANYNVSPVVIGTKMVERVINMRKLAPPKKDDKQSPHSHLSGKSSSSDSSGFGRTLSKKSLDMAIRHMDIRRTIPGNLRPLMTNIPASSLYSVRSGATKKTVSASDSPHGTSSNASSEVSVNNNALCVDGPELDDEASSDKGIESLASLHGSNRDN